MNFAFAVVWCLVATIAFRAGFGRVIRESTGAWIATIAVVLAFIVGYAWPYSAAHDVLEGTRAVSETASPSSALGVAATEPLTGLRDTSRVCKIEGGLPNGEGLGFLDTVASKDAAQTGDPIARSSAVVARGWAVQMGDKAPVDTVCLIVDGREPRQGLRIGVPRPDVAQSLGSPKSTNAGFVVELPPQSIAAGTHFVRAFSLSTTDGPRRLHGSLTLTVR